MGCGNRRIEGVKDRDEMEMSYREILTWDIILITDIKIDDPPEYRKYRVGLMLS